MFRRIFYPVPNNRDVLINREYKQNGEIKMSLKSAWDKAVKVAKEPKSNEVALNVFTGVGIGLVAATVGTGGASLVAVGAAVAVVASIKVCQGILNLKKPPTP